MLSRTLAKRRAPRRTSALTYLARLLPAFVSPPLPWCTCIKRATASTSSRRATTMSAARATSPPLSPATAPSHPTPTISLTAQEAAIFSILSRVRRDEGLHELTLRVAGGWVRDKVLGRATGKVDIDIALDTLLGREFAEIVNVWLTKHSMETTSVGVIQRNPDQSKHLETATMRVMDVWLDIVNLRTETYSSDSRIPEMAIGTPLEDAMRRDLTINALFYNINTGLVEDLTGRGISDIHARVVRTPLPPLTTLLDDPLRALRAIRFASRLNFSFDSELFDACKHRDVRRALETKVSRERVAAEIDGIMRSDRPTHAIGLLVELGVFPIVFRVLTAEEQYVGDGMAPADLPERAIGALLNLEALWNAAANCDTTVSPPVGRLATPPSDTRICAYAALLAPLAGIEYRMGRKNKVAPVVQYVLGEQLHMSTRDVADVVCVHDAALQFTALASAAASVGRLDAGLVMRKAGPRWREAIQIAAVAEMQPATCGSCVRGVDEKHRILEASCMGVVDKYARFMQQVDEFGLDGVWQMKPLINGREMFKLLPRLKKGPMVGTIMQRQIEWMISNPNAGTDEAKQWLVDNFNEIM